RVAYGEVRAEDQVIRPQAGVSHHRYLEPVRRRGTQWALQGPLPFFNHRQGCHAFSRAAREQLVGLTSPPDTTWPVSAPARLISERETSLRFRCQLSLLRHVRSDRLALVFPTPRVAGG